jgi:hypothetical protein
MNRRNSQRGNILIFVVLMLGLFLLAAIGIAVDLSNIWLHRQAAQTAADAACTAGVMDMLQSANGTMTPAWWTPTTAGGSVVDCTSTTPNTARTVPAPCWYAAKNGYSSAGLVAGQPSQSVKLTFLNNGASWGATVEPGDEGFDLAGSAPFLRVDVVDRVQVHFLALVGPRTTDVPAMAGCGLQLAQAPIPIIVLDPDSSGSMSSNGTGSLRILGGPVQSVQVNSSNQVAVANQLDKTGGYGGPINLTQGGPNYDGSSFGVTGGPLSPVSGFSTATSGLWMSPSAPVSDPFAKIDPPDRPLDPPLPTDLVGMCTSTTIKNGSCTVPYLTHGCPDHAGCTFYSGGLYSSGIKVKGSETAVFDPGTYYLEKSLWLASNSIARTNTTVGAGDGRNGTVFYLTGTPTGGACKDLLCVDSNSGKLAGGMVVDSFSIFTAQCPGGAPIDPKLIATLDKDITAGLPMQYTGLNGNLLLAPCTGPYGDPSGSGQYRGMLFFADRTQSVTGSWSGGGESLMAGNAYFHHTTGFDSNFILQGNSCSSSYILGEIVTDHLDFGGTPCINMVLNPNAKYPVLKAALMK